jgi:anti-sigma-K factor RskA
VDTQNYKDSGILELYVMDALPPDEKSEVERRAALDPAIAREIREIREALALLDRHHERAPRRELRRSILDAIDRDEAGLGGRSLTGSEVGLGDTSRIGAEREVVRDADVGDAGRSATVIPMTTGPSTREAGVTPAHLQSPVRYNLAASWILVAISVGAAAWFGIQWRSAAEEAELLREENRQLAGANSVIASRAQSAERAMTIMRSADYHAVQLNGTEHAPTVHPVVYWNPSSREVVLIAKNLPAPPAGKQYQLWAIHDNKRIDAGVFDVDGRIDTMQRLKDIEAAEAFAVTLERAGGSPIPDLNAVYAVGSL